MRLAVRWCWLFLAVSSAQALNVRKIDLEGFNRVPVADIRAGLPLRPGQAYETAHGDEARSWLMGLGLFVSVDLSTRPEGGVVDLRFKVVENPDVRVVRFEGNTQVAAAAFRMDLLTQPRKILNRRELARDVAVIGKTYLEQGMRVVVETAYDPEPTDPATPVAVIFKITEIKIGKVEIEPIHYLRREKLAPLLLLKAGDLVVESALLEQRQKLGASGLFDQVHPPATSEPSAEGTVDVLYRVQERDNPVLTREYLELIDLARLVRHVRFNAVDVSVDSRDLEVYVPAAELRTRLQAAQQAAQARPQDAEALYEWFQLAR
ncbi:MAG: hypothetical protein HUU35_03155, partial [Armatimonadetes bacterium]|nr:hypothetical protein [Armatimonadota bacterium]